MPSTPKNEPSKPSDEAEVVRKPIDLEAVGADESDPNSDDRSPGKTDRDYTPSPQEGDASDTRAVRKPIDLDAIAASESDSDSDDRSPGKTDRDYTP